MDSGMVYGLEGRTALGLVVVGSASKPFCDGSHRSTFEHESKAFDLPPMKTTIFSVYHKKLHFN
jgi:CDGSH-type Zn-finger protein